MPISNDYNIFLFLKAIFRKINAFRNSGELSTVTMLLAAFGVKIAI